jgi:hypothetical protein
MTEERFRAGDRKISFRGWSYAPLLRTSSDTENMVVKFLKRYLPRSHDFDRRMTKRVSFFRKQGFGGISPKDSSGSVFNACIYHFTTQIFSVFEDRYIAIDLQTATRTCHLALDRCWVMHAGEWLRKSGDRNKVPGCLYFVSVRKVLWMQCIALFLDSAFSRYVDPIHKNSLLSLKLLIGARFTGVEQLA